MLRRWGLQRMSKKALQIIAIIGLIFMTAFAVFFTIGLYFRFKEPFNALSLFSLAIGAPMSCIVWFFKRREKNTQELLKKIKEEEEKEQEVQDNKETTKVDTEQNTEDGNNGQKN